MRILKKLAAGIVLIAQLASVGNAIAQAMPATVFEPTSQPGGGWSYDPSKEGMRDLFEMLPIEGCNAPGGLTRITDRDEADSAPFWCGPAPHCLAEGTNGVDACTFVPYCRREPRGSPSGIPGANGCRDPEDLRCVSSGAQPEGGRCLKTCWDGSRILFSSACPPQTVCSTDALGATTCTTIYDTPPSAQPRTPPTPIPGPAPDPLGCFGGSGAYEACFFTLAATEHNQTQTVASSSGVNGSLSAVCNNGGWTITSISCDASTVMPTTPPTTPSGPAPLPRDCGGDTFTKQSCVFQWLDTPHGASISVSPVFGGTGTLTATCKDGSWINRLASCTPVEDQKCPDGTAPVNGSCLKTCDNGSRIPQNQVCPPPTQTCWDGTVISVYQACPPQLKTCPDGTVVSVYQVCPEPQFQTCPDGSVIPASAVCPEAMKTCPDGSVIPASAVCYTPPPPQFQICASGITNDQGACYSISPTDGYGNVCTVFSPPACGASEPISSFSTSPGVKCFTITTGNVTYSPPGTMCERISGEIPSMYDPVVCNFQGVFTKNNCGG